VESRIKPNTDGEIMKPSTASIFWKAISFQIIYLILHYSYDWFPNKITHLFSGTDESVYQHMKLAFYAYFPVVIGEIIFQRKSIQSRVNFSYARILSFTILPLFVMVYFLASPAFFIKIENILLEIIFANIALIASTISTFKIEDHFEKNEPNLGLKIILIVLFLLTLFEFIIFNFRLPWFDIFAVPPGWE
jgi:hypothetical protein